MGETAQGGMSKKDQAKDNRDKRAVEGLTDQWTLNWGGGEGEEEFNHENSYVNLYPGRTHTNSPGEK